MTAKLLPLALSLVIVAGSTLARDEAPSRSSERSQLLRRNYVPGQKLVYRMTGVNRRPGRTLNYEATAEGVVKQDSAGRFYEEYRWSRVTIAGKPLELPTDSSRLVQVLSLSPTWVLAMPALSRVPPALIGPMTDLLTFYADVWLAMKQPKLQRPGDRMLVPHAGTNSWADGSRVLLGEDAVDFDIAIKDVDVASGTVTLLVRHVPPAQSAIEISADWMREPVADVPNNWVQVSLASDGTYRAGVGKETFDVEIKLSLADGSILSARMDNPVEIAERDCADKTLTQCGEATNYQIVRVVEIARVQ